MLVDRLAIWQNLIVLNGSYLFRFSSGRQIYSGEGHYVRPIVKLDAIERARNYVTVALPKDIAV